jgi:hypothetical protein
MHHFVKAFVKWQSESADQAIVQLLSLTTIQSSTVLRPTRPASVGTARTRTCCFQGRGVGSCSVRLLQQLIIRPRQDPWKMGVVLVENALMGVPPEQSLPRE